MMYVVYGADDMWLYCGWGETEEAARKDAEDSAGGPVPVPLRVKPCTGKQAQEFSEGDFSSLDSLS